MLDVSDNYSRGMKIPKGGLRTAISPKHMTKLITGREERKESRGCSHEPEFRGMVNVQLYFLAIWFPTMFVGLSFLLSADGTYEDVIVTM